jgi:hypothetical protein
MWSISEVVVCSNMEPLALAFSRCLREDAASAEVRDRRRF